MSEIPVEKSSGNVFADIGFAPVGARSRFGCALTIGGRRRATLSWRRLSPAGNWVQAATVRQRRHVDHGSSDG